eukprot:GFUD01016404.1.p1 GENE.GFUD01016404.1~~GFUD01016404.1.p1  ORF type:complete len:218 (+),score=72.85 GFUD01016404.1:50-703(+)
MPQEFQVLRCFKCETFQVSQVKKATKWVCKICQEKQSTKQVYSRGSGAECRKVVQELNWKRMELGTAREELLLDQEVVESVQDEIFDDNYEEIVDDNYEIKTIENPVQRTGGRWAAFLPPPVEEKREAVAENTETDQQPAKKARLGCSLNSPSVCEVERQVTVSAVSRARDSLQTSPSHDRSSSVSESDPQLSSLPPIQSKWSKFVCPTQNHSRNSF